MVNPIKILEEVKKNINDNVNSITLDDKEYLIIKADILDNAIDEIDVVKDILYIIGLNEITTPT